MATLLFLHGLAGHGAEWDAVADELDAAHAWMAPDMRGHQGRAVDPHPLTRDAFVADAAAWLRPEDRNIVIGQSMGGIVATLLASARPDLVHGLVLVEAGTDELSTDTLASITKWLDSWPDHFASTAEATAFFGPNKATTPTWIAGLIPTPDGFEPRFVSEDLVEIMRVLAGPDRWDAWRTITVPTLILRGDAGALLAEDAERMRAEHGKPDAVRVVEIAGAGHDVHLDQPAPLAEAMSMFIGELPPASM